MRKWRKRKIEPDDAELVYTVRVWEEARGWKWNVLTGYGLFYNSVIGSEGNHPNAETAEAAARQFVYDYSTREKLIAEREKNKREFQVRV